MNYYLENFNWWLNINFLLYFWNLNWLKLKCTFIHLVHSTCVLQMCMLCENDTSDTALLIVTIVESVHFYKAFKLFRNALFGFQLLYWHFLMKRSNFFIRLFTFLLVFFTAHKKNSLLLYLNYSHIKLGYFIYFIWLLLHPIACVFLINELPLN